MKTYEQFNELVLNESIINKLGITKESVQRDLDIIQSKIPLNKFLKFIKKNKKRIKYIIDNFTNKRNVVYIDKIVTKNEGFKDNIFYDFFINTFKGDWMEKVLGVLAWTLSLVIALNIYILGVMVYYKVFYTPMDKGVVVKTEYVAEHDVSTPMYYYIGNTTTVTYVTSHIPASYNIYVKDLKNDNIELWSTSNLSVGSNINKNDTISWDEATYSVLNKEN